MPQTPPPSADCPKVDTHAHIYHKGMQLAPDAWAHPAHEALLEDYLAELKAGGIDRAVLAAASVYGTNNEYSLEAASTHPNLRTTVIVDPATDLAMLQERARRGAVGVRLQWRSTPELPDLRTAEYRALFTHIADLGWHVQLHDNGARLPEAIAEIEPYGMPLVVDHFGRPSVEDGAACRGFRAALDAVQRGNCWIKLSAAFRIGSDSLVGELADILLREAGPERLLWGSDWPFVQHEGTITYAATLAQFERLVSEPAIRERIHASANALYFADS